MKIKLTEAKNHIKSPVPITKVEDIRAIRLPKGLTYLKDLPPEETPWGTYEKSYHGQGNPDTYGNKYIVGDTGIYVLHTLEVHGDDDYTRAGSLILIPDLGNPSEYYVYDEYYYDDGNWKSEPQQLAMYLYKGGSVDDLLNPRSDYAPGFPRNVMSGHRFLYRKFPAL